MTSAKEQFLQAWENEFKTTIKVLKAFPLERENYRPHEKSKSAKELAHIFSAEEQTAFVGAMEGNIDWSKMPKTPETMKEVIEGFEHAHKEAVEKFKHTSEEQLGKTMKFFVAPKTQADLPIMTVLWTMLMDQIHHRGQFSVYLRLVGAKIPSIYGPTADEPWM